MEEVRLTQHICFKTSKKELQNKEMKEKQRSMPCEESKQITKNPLLKIQIADPMSPNERIEPSILQPFNSPKCSAEYTPPSTMKKSFLFVPKMDNRDRLTSTPNQDIHKASSAMNMGQESDAAFSPVICIHETNAVMHGDQFSIKNENLDELRGILFPMAETSSKEIDDECFNSQGFISDFLDSAIKRKRASSSEESSPVLFHTKSKPCQKARNCMDIDEITKPIFPCFISNDHSATNSPHKIKLAPYSEDSGLGCTYVSADCDKTDLSLDLSLRNNSRNGMCRSPLKRPAGRDEPGAISVESPMKRLAFMSLENCQLSNEKNNRASDNMEQLRMPEKISLFNEEPGYSFLSDRSLAQSEGNSTCDSGYRSIHKQECMQTSSYSMTAPIFPNSIPFNLPSDAASATVKLLASPVKSSHEANDFKFTKPSLVLRKPRKRQEKRSPKTSSSSSDDNVQSPAKEGYAKNIIGWRMGMQHVDFVTELTNIDLRHVLVKIFSHIRPKDILRCSHVSESWSNVFNRNKFLQRQIRSLKKQYKEEESSLGSENFSAEKAQQDALLKSPAKLSLESKRNLISGRNVFGNLQMRGGNSPVKKMVLLPKTPSGKNHFVPVTTKFEHNQSVKRTLSFGEGLKRCRKCGWTAKIYGRENRGQCYNADCRYRFCVLCDTTHHWPNPCPAKVNTSPSFVSTKDFRPGSKKSMNRLKKRLLM